MVEKKDKKLNLKSFDNMDKEEHLKIASKGGVNSGIARRRKKEVQKILEAFLELPLKKGKLYDVDDVKSFMALKGKNITVNEAIQVTVIQKALKGDLSAINMINELMGEKPNKNVNINANVTKNPISDLTTEELRKLINQNDGKE